MPHTLKCVWHSFHFIHKQSMHRIRCMLCLFKFYFKKYFLSPVCSHFAKINEFSGAFLKHLCPDVDYDVLHEGDFWGGWLCAGCRLTMTYVHGLINYKETKTECRLYWCLLEFIDWEYSQSYWYFWPSLVNYCPSNLLSSSAPPPPSLCY